MFGNLDIGDVVGGKIEDFINNREYGKIVDGKLETIDVLEPIRDGFDFILQVKDPKELLGYKVVVRDNEKPYPNVYQNVVERFEENLLSIKVFYILEDKPEEEIIQINKDFWAANYTQMINLMPATLYAANTSTKDGVTMELKGLTFLMMIRGVELAEVTGEPFVLEFYAEPDYTRKLDAAYLKTLKIMITEPSQIESSLGYIGSLVFTDRDVPTVI